MKILLKPVRYYKYTVYKRCRVCIIAAYFSFEKQAWIWLLKVIINIQMYLITLWMNITPRHLCYVWNCTHKGFYTFLETVINLIVSLKLNLTFFLQIWFFISFNSSTTNQIPRNECNSVWVYNIYTKFCMGHTLSINQLWGTF